MSEYPIFSVLGIEIEYMLVDKDTLVVQPKSDLILKALAGKQVNEVVLGDIAISNELVMHVLELKNNGPKAPQVNVVEQFQTTIKNLQRLLNQHNLMLLPTGAHPFMDPHKETVRWPHGDNAIYKQFDSIFNCQGHGWANLQSMHVNLPYSNEEEFFQLHNLVRLILPLLPALAASSPILDGKSTGLLDSRLDFYGKNQKKIPSISGDIIPDFIYSQAHYKQSVLEPMYEDIRPFDPDGILQYEWLNSRGAIPKFEHKAIEIRILDSQECVNSDMAIAKAILAILQYWQKATDYPLEKPCETKRLKSVFDKTIRDGLAVVVDDMELLRQWQLPRRAMTLREVCSLLIEGISTELEQSLQLNLEYILSKGNLSERILRAINHTSIKEVYMQLSQCLLYNQKFESL
ncbi:MAG: glutamate--cysteine ligase [Legionella sp.]|nr:glutamate--cysteine ligase [Legionella sp.]